MSLLRFALRFIPRRSPLLVLCLALVPCHGRAADPGSIALGAVRADFVQSSAAGDRLRPLPSPHFSRGRATESVTVRVELQRPRQTVLGIGGALTEASAYVLAQLPRAARDSVVAGFFGPTGADYTLARTHVGACDFTLHGNYSYDDTRGDTALAHFSIAHDERGFDTARDPRYALMPLLRDALARQPALKIVASPWTAPAWMKDNDAFYVQGHGGGHLQPQYYDTFARYMGGYVADCAAAGVPIWAVTPENEPLGVGGQWESMEMSPEELRDYIAYHLGPALAPTGVRILQYDQNRGDDAVRYSRATLGDAACGRQVYGTAVHWYNTTNSACTATLDALHALAPDKPVLHTEGCIDALGSKTNSPDGKFLGWRNDAWWWSPVATDWGWDWAPAADKPLHPRYTPVHRYARDLIDGLNHWLAGWIDWNAVLDSRGGPNHVDNRCAAPVMVDTAAGDVYVTPLFDTIAHFSRYIRPGDRVLASRVSASHLGADDFRAVAVLDATGEHLVVVALNTSGSPISWGIEVGHRHVSVSIPANALQTLRFSAIELRD
jgi:glucosylceramidase